MTLPKLKTLRWVYEEPDLITIPVTYYPSDSASEKMGLALSQTQVEEGINTEEVIDFSIVMAVRFAIRDEELFPDICIIETTLGSYEVRCPLSEMVAAWVTYRKWENDVS